MTGTDESPKKNLPVYSAEDGRKALYKSIENSSDPHVRRFATFFLGQMKNKEEIGYLGALLRDPDKGVREQATRALAESGQQGFDILSGLLRDKEWKVRYRACEALGMMQNRDAIPLLAAALDDEKDHVRYMAAKSLGMIGNQSAELPLIARINDENEFVRKSVAGSLGKLGGTASVDAFHKQLEFEQSGEVIKVIRGSISSIQEKTKSGNIT